MVDQSVGQESLYLLEGGRDEASQRGVQHAGSVCAPEFSNSNCLTVSTLNPSLYSSPLKHHCSSHQSTLLQQIHCPQQDILRQLLLIPNSFLLAHIQMMATALYLLCIFLCFLCLTLCFQPFNGHSEEKTRGKLFPFYCSLGQ